MGCWGVDEGALGNAALSSSTLRAFGQEEGDRTRLLSGGCRCVRGHSPAVASSGCRSQMSPELQTVSLLSALI